MSRPRGLTSGPQRRATGVGAPAGAYAAAGELLKALSAPVRIAIVTMLSSGPRCVHELVGELAVAQPLVSQHLRVLRGAGLVTAERRGREVAYHLADDHVGHLVADAVAHAEEGHSDTALGPRLGRTPPPAPSSERDGTYQGSVSSA